MTLSKNYETAIAELALSLSLLVRRIRLSTPSESHDLSWTQKAVLSRLDKGEPMTAAELARAASIKPQSMGAAIATLAEMGLLERKAHPTDGRQINIELTAKGTEMRKNARDARRTWLAQAIAKLDKQDQETLFAAGEIIKRLVNL